MDNQTDFFGIGNAIEAMVNVYRISSRASGRTTSMLNSVKDGDRIVFNKREERDRVEKILRQRNLDVKCLYIDTKEPDKIFHYPTNKGRTIFDHSWVEEFYMNAIQETKKQIRFFETESSGYGEAHEKTKQKAMEIMKWR